MKILSSIALSMLLVTLGVEAASKPITRASGTCACKASGSPFISCGNSSCTAAPITFCCLEALTNETVDGLLTVGCETVNQNITIDGEVDIAGNLLVEGTGSFSKDVLVEKNFCDFESVTVDGSETVQGSLTVNTQTIINGTAGSIVFMVNGNEQLNGNYTATGNETVSKNLTIEGNATLNSTLTVAKNATFNEDVTVEGNLTVVDDLAIGGTETIEGTLTVNNGGTINGASCVFTVNGNETVNGSKTINGPHTVDQNLSVAGASTFNGPLAVNAGFTTSGQTIEIGGLTILNGGAAITGTTTITGITTAEDVHILGNLIEQETSFLSNTTLNGTLTANGAVVMNKGLTISTGNETITTGDLTLINGSLTVAGLTTLSNTVTAQNGALINNALTIYNGQTINTGDLITAACSDMTISGELTVDQTINSPALCFCQDLEIDGLTPTTSDTTGSLTVAGGMGIAKQLYLGGSQYFSNVTAQGGTPSGLNYYEEACFSTTFQHGSSTSNEVTIQIIRIGKLVNLIIPLINFPAVAESGFVIISTNPLPARFTPFVTVRGVSSTISCDYPGLGEFEITPDGYIIFGIPGSIHRNDGSAPAALGPQPVTAAIGADLDPNTITYNILSCGCPF